MKIELNSKERQILLDALIHPGYLDKVQQPKTPFFIRELHRNLKTKIAMQEVESMELKPERAIKLLKKEINFINFKYSKMNGKEKKEAQETMLDYDKARHYLEDL